MHVVGSLALVVISLHGRGFADGNVISLLGISRNGLFWRCFLSRERGRQMSNRGLSFFGLDLEIDQRTSAFRSNIAMSIIG
jgi:hypothetical protein